MADGKKLTRILSIDGGGIRGIIPGQILVNLEDMLKEASGKQDARIADYFDLIAGTSTGGILTCIYLCPEKPGSKKPRFSAKKAVDLYLDRGDEIFEVSLWQKIKSGSGLLDEKYSADELEESLEDYFTDLKLSELIKPCLVTAYNIRNRKTHFFTQHTAKKRAEEDFYVRDVARATSAAPTYFEAARIKSLANVPFPLVDGGVFANNPTLCAYAEARKFKEKPTAKEMVILSLGTGEIKKPYYYKDAKDWGLIEWAKPVLDIIMSGVAETVDYQLKQIYQAVGKPKQYVRIQTDLRGSEASPEMDNASHENLKALESVGDQVANDPKNKKDLKQLVKLLVENAG